MDHLINGILWAGGVAGAIASILGIIRLIKQPYDALKDKVDAHEAFLNELKQMIADNKHKLESDKKSLSEQENVNLATLKAISAILRRASEEEMQKCAKEIDELVLKKGSRL